LATAVNGCKGGHPLSATQIVDQCSDDRNNNRNQVYLGSTPYLCDVWVWLTGYNDMRYFGTDATALEAYTRVLRAAVAFISRLPNDRFEGASAAWAFAGSWTSISVCGISTRY